jgi:hypothetical protein
MQSKQVSASASRSIVNYRLTCGFSASVFLAGCTERGQGAASQGAPAAFASRDRFAGGISVRRAVGARGENALDLIRRVVSDRQPIHVSGLKCSYSKRCAFC